MQQEITLLSKSLHPLPEKFHGLTDTDTALPPALSGPDHERRNPRDAFIKRSRNHLARSAAILNGQGFLEVETPMLVANAGGAAARPFETHFNALDEDFKLRISLELYLKRLIVGGLEKRLRDRPRVPQRGAGHPPQSGIHADGALSGVHRLPRHDGSDREPVSLRRTGRCWAPRRSRTTASRWISASRLSASRWSMRSRSMPAWILTQIHTLEEAARGRKGAQHRVRSAPQEGRYPESVLRGIRRGAPDSADVRNGSSGGNLAADQEASPDKPGLCGALRVLHERLGDGERLFRAERPDRPARALCKAQEELLAQRRRGSQPHRRGLPQRAGDRYAARRAASASASTACACC